jgi:Protein of unknown function (DUF4197)
MRTRLLTVCLALLLGWTMPVRAGLDAVSNQEAASGLKAALEKGSGTAVDLLGKTDGFLANKAVKIPLPGSLKKYEKLMRSVGMGKYADELIVTMNRAAEAAVPEAKTLFVDAIKKMSLKDAKGILTGGQTAGTEYFKRTTSGQLREKFLPIVKSATAKVQLAETYNEYAQKGAQFGLVSKEYANLDDYVTQKSLDGLFYMVAEEEKKIRQNPLQEGSDIIKKVFGALK